MKKELSEIFRSKLKQDAKIFFESSLWPEMVKGLFELRSRDSRLLEVCPLKDQAGIWQAAKLQGQIDGYEEIIRMIQAILDVEYLPGLEHFRGV